MNLVDPERFKRICRDNGLIEVKSRTIPLKKGKALFMGYYIPDTQMKSER